MTSKEYIYKTIDRLVNKFPMSRISYDFDGIDNTHILEVLPHSLYNDESTFGKIEDDILSEFFKLFPFEGLYFINEESLVRMESPIYSRAGANHGFRKYILFDEGFKKQEPQRVKPDNHFGQDYLQFAA